MKYPHEQFDTDAILNQAYTVLSIWLAALAILFVYIVIGGVIARAKRSPVEKLLRRRFG